MKRKIRKCQLLFFLLVAFSWFYFLSVWCFACGSFVFCSNEWEWKREKGKDAKFTFEISQDEQQIKSSRTKQTKNPQPTKKKKKKKRRKEKKRRIEKKITQTISEPHALLRLCTGPAVSTAGSTSPSHKRTIFYLQWPNQSWALKLSQHCWALSKITFSLAFPACAFAATGSFYSFPFHPVSSRFGLHVRAASMWNTGSPFLSAVGASCRRSPAL